MNGGGCPQRDKNKSGMKIEEESEEESPLRLLGSFWNDHMLLC
jgi:hypothetical protein